MKETGKHRLRKAMSIMLIFALVASVSVASASMFIGEIGEKSSSDKIFLTANGADRVFAIEEFDGKRWEQASVANVFGTAKKIEPGSSGRYEFTLVNERVVPVTYEATITEENGEKVPMLLRLKDELDNVVSSGDAEGWVEMSGGSSTGIAFNNVLSALTRGKYVLEWKWPFETANGDARDTALGVLATQSAVKYNVKFDIKAEAADEPIVEFAHADIISGKLTIDTAVNAGATTVNTSIKRDAEIADGFDVSDLEFTLKDNTCVSLVTTYDADAKLNLTPTGVGATQLYAKYKGVVVGTLDIEVVDSTLPVEPKVEFVDGDGAVFSTIAVNMTQQPNAFPVDIGLSGDNVTFADVVFRIVGTAATVAKSGEGDQIIITPVESGTATIEAVYNDKVIGTLAVTITENPIVNFIGTGVADNAVSLNKAVQGAGIQVEAVITGVQTFDELTFVTGDSAIVSATKVTGSGNFILVVPEGVGSTTINAMYGSAIVGTLSVDVTNTLPTVTFGGGVEGDSILINKSLTPTGIEIPLVIAGGITFDDLTIRAEDGAIVSVQTVAGKDSTMLVIPSTAGTTIVEVKYGEIVLATLAVKVINELPIVNFGGAGVADNALTINKAINADGIEVEVLITGVSTLDDLTFTAGDGTVLTATRVTGSNKCILVVPKGTGIEKVLAEYSGIKVGELAVEVVDELPTVQFGGEVVSGKVTINKALKPTGIEVPVTVTGDLTFVDLTIRAENGLIASLQVVEGKEATMLVIPTGVGVTTVNATYNGVILGTFEVTVIDKLPTVDFICDDIVGGTLTMCKDKDVAGKKVKVVVSDEITFDEIEFKAKDGTKIEVKVVPESPSTLLIIPSAVGTTKVSAYYGDILLGSLDIGVTEETTTEPTTETTTTTTTETTTKPTTETTTTTEPTTETTTTTTTTTTEPITETTTEATTTTTTTTTETTTTTTQPTTETTTTTEPVTETTTTTSVDPSDTTTIGPSDTTTTKKGETTTETTTQKGVIGEKGDTPASGDDANRLLLFVVLAGAVSAALYVARKRKEDAAE